ncbi:MAG: hypothetical protein ACTHOI_01490 [Sphingomicrobium sp.]
MSGQRTSQKDCSVRFEPRDVPPLVPLGLAAGLAGFIIAVLAGITLSFPLADRQEYRGPLQRLPPEPRLQVAAAEDLTAYRTAKRKELENAPLPIDAAMRKTVEQGWGPPR